jgi:hypothetical protein
MVELRWLPYADKRPVDRRPRNTHFSFRIGNSRFLPWNVVVKFSSTSSASWLDEEPRKLEKNIWRTRPLSRLLESTDGLRKGRDVQAARESILRCNKAFGMLGKRNAARVLCKEPLSKPEVGDADAEPTMKLIENAKIETTIRTEMLELARDLPPPCLVGGSRIGYTGFLCT